MYNNEYNRSIASEVKKINKKFIRQTPDEVIGQEQYTEGDACHHCQGSGLLSGLLGSFGLGKSKGKNKPVVCHHCQGSGLLSGLFNSFGLGYPAEHGNGMSGGGPLSAMLGMFGFGHQHPHHKHMEHFAHNLQGSGFDLKQILGILPHVLPLLGLGQSGGSKRGKGISGGGPLSGLLGMFGFGHHHHKHIDAFAHHLHGSGFDLKQILGILPHVLPLLGLGHSRGSKRGKYSENLEGSGLLDTFNSTLMDHAFTAPKLLYNAAKLIGTAYLKKQGAGRTRRGGGSSGGDSTGGGKSKRYNKRGEIVKHVMQEQGLSMINASRYVKEHNLY